MSSGKARQLQIDLILGNYNPIEEWFTNLWCNLGVAQVDVYNTGRNEKLYYTKDSMEWIFYRNLKKDEIWCNMKTYWDVLSLQFKLSVRETRAVTRILLENVNQYDIEPIQASCEKPIIEIALSKIATNES